MADRNPKISCVQWRMRTLSGLGKFLGEIEKHVREQAEQGSDLILFPELFSLGLLDPRKEGRAAMDELARHTPSITDYCAELAKKYRINILAGSLPRREYGRLFNVSTFCHRDGRPSESQCKLHPTPYEREHWDMQGGEDLHAFDTDIGRCGVLICYDVEFPELPRLLREQDVNLLLVPYWADSINAHHRVRFCARARAIENECYVAMAGSFGEVAGNDVIDFQYAQSAVFSPSDSAFSEQAILAEAPVNTETSIIAELDFGKLEQLRRSGTVQTGHDRRRDLYQIAWHGKPHMQFTPLIGRQIGPYLKELAQLRIKVFRDFPYLYDGSLDYEKKYLQSYIKSSRSLVFLIRDGGRTVGATTALPMVDADPDFHAPFVKQGVPLEDVFYFGESVLLPEYRGRGYGHRFFDEREAHARQLGFPITTFCVVVRDTNHPARPKDFSSFASFWTKRGYRLAEGFTCQYHWKDVGDSAETEKVMQFWIKGL